MKERFEQFLQALCSVLENEYDAENADYQFQGEDIATVLMFQLVDGDEADEEFTFEVKWLPTCKVADRLVEMVEVDGVILEANFRAAATLVVNV